MDRVELTSIGHDGESCNFQWSVIATNYTLSLPLHTWPETCEGALLKPLEPILDNPVHWSLAQLWPLCARLAGGLA